MMRTTDDAEERTTDYADYTDGEIGWGGCFLSYLCDLWHLWFTRPWNPRRREEGTRDYMNGEREDARGHFSIRVIRVIRGPSLRGIRAAPSR